MLQPGAGATMYRCSATSATRSSPGHGRRRRSCSTESPVSLPCTRCRSGRTWPVCALASTPGTARSVSYLGEVRKHAGMMVPGPAQAAAVSRSTTTRPSPSSADATNSGSPAWLRRCRSGRESNRAPGWRFLPLVPRRRRVAVRRAARGRWWRLGEPGGVLWRCGPEYVRVAVVQPDAVLSTLASRLGVTP